MNKEGGDKPTYREWKAENLDRLIGLFHETFGNQIHEIADFFEAQYDKEMQTMSDSKRIKHGEIGAPRNAGDYAVGEIPPVGSMKVVVLNGSRQIDQVVPGLGVDGAGGWQTQKVESENGLPKGIYPLHNSVEAAKNVHPQQFGGQLLHVDKKHVYQFGPDNGKGKPSVIKHDRKIFDMALEGREPVVGQCYEVTYARGQGKVKGELSQEEGAKLQARKALKI